MIEYELIRSKRRKTLGLQVKHGQVTVRAPYAISSVFIDTFVQDKSAWLYAKIAVQHESNKSCNYSQHSSLLLLGEEVRLKIGISKQAHVFLSPVSDKDDNIYQQPSPQLLNVVISEKVYAKLNEPVERAKQVKKQLESYFKQQAEQLIRERLKRISLHVSLIPKKITIRQYSARWGSCNSRGEVSFNYFLMMTPLFVIDYVIVHELCHLVYLDHSKNFWDLVAKYFPDYQLAKKWLVAHQTTLYWQKPL
jgi:predicted metal-dependent hydrolase